MKKFADLPILVKFLISGIGTIITLVVIFFFFYYKTDRAQTIQSLVEKSRSICLISESVRDEMEQKWELGLFSIAQMKEWLQTNDMDKILGAVPVVSAWQASMRKAEQGGYIFKVPKFSPRNPKNEPDYGHDYEIEGPALEKIKKENLDEYFVIDEKNNSVRYFLPVRLSEICMICHGDPKQSMTLWGRDDGKDPTGGVFEDWEVGEIHGAFEVIQSLDKADASLKSRMMKAFVVILFGILAAAAIFFFVTRSITRPITHGVEFTQNMAEGDLRQNLDISQNDEIGQLSKAMNIMIENLRKIIESINSSVAKLKSSSAELISASGSMSSEAESTSEMATTVAASAEEMSGNMTSVAATVEETSTNVGMVAAAAEEMSATISEIAKNSEKSRQITKSAVSKSESAATKVKELGVAANEIGHVTSTISDISDQTNLLALNATIEASRAGEAGKGFSVVANEIKELARQTADATDQISEKIERMQTSTNETTVEIDEISKVINEINDIVTTIAAAVEEQSTATKEIAENVSQASIGIADVTENVSQSSAVSTDVAENITLVSNSASEISGRSVVVMDNANELSTISSQLSELMKKFKLK